MSNASGSASLGEGSDAPQVLAQSPDRDNHKIPILYSEEKQVSGWDTEAFSRNQPYVPSHHNADYRYINHGEQQSALQTLASNGRICGLRPGWLWTSAVSIVLLLVGATAGGVVAGMMRQQSQKPSSASATSSAPAAELQDSHLSAVNWTDSSGAQRKAVFYQRNRTLHVSHSDGGGDGTVGWTELNIEDQFSAGAVAVMNATPLAASVIGGADADADTSFSAALYFLDAGNHIRDLVSTADDLATWTKGPLWNVSITASAMSGLAAAVHVCADGCLGDRIVVFQVNSGDLYSVHGPDWSGAPTRIVGASIGTPLALTPAAYVNSTSGAVDWTAAPTQLRLYYHRDINIDEFFFNDERPLDWNAGTDGSLTARPAAGSVGVVSGLEASEALPGLAAAPSGPNSVVQVTALKGSGSAVVSYVRGATGRFEDNTCDLPARFANGDSVSDEAPSPEGAAAVSLSHNFGLYVLTSNGTRILECQSQLAPSPSCHFTRGLVLSVRRLPRDNCNLPEQRDNVATDGWSNASPDSFRFQGNVV